MNENAQAALADALKALGADSGTIHTARARVLHLAAWAGGMPEPVLNVIREIPWGKGMAGAAAERVEPVGTCNLQTTQSADVRPGAKATQLRGTLVVPMMLGDEVAGTFGIGCNGERLFSVEETRELWRRAARLARELAPPPAEALRALLAARVSPEALAWLDGVTDVRVAFPAVSRQLGREPLGESGALVSVGGEEVPLRAWRVDDAGRALLILRHGDEALARELYFGGDLRERAGALRALGVVGRSAAAADTLSDAMRLAADELVEAAVADNPYVRFMDPHELRRAALKAAAIGISLDRVAVRGDAELSTMLLSLVTEREMAGRAVPPSVWPLLAAAPPPGLAAKLLGYLEHPNAEHRTGAVRALARLDDPRTRPFLDDRRARESDASVLRALAWIAP
jgi:hypothetical protein